MIGIYRITHRNSGRHYVGQSADIEKRWCSHKQTSKCLYISRALAKYGVEAFDFVVLCECKLSELDSLEIYWIEKLCAVEFGFNLKTGGKHSRLCAEACERISATQKARWVSDYERLIAIRLGIAKDPAVRGKISKSLKTYHSNLDSDKSAELKAARAAGIRRVADKIGSKTAERWQNPEMRQRMLKKGPLPQKRKSDLLNIQNKEGRKITATAWELVNSYGVLTAAQVSNLKTGYRKVCSGWSLQPLTDSQPQA